MIHYRPATVFIAVISAHSVASPLQDHVNISSFTWKLICCCYVVSVLTWVCMSLSYLCVSSLSSSLFPLVCPSVLFKWFIFLSDKDDTWQDNDDVFHPSNVQLHFLLYCFCFLFLCFVTPHRSPPTPLRFCSALAWLVIMLMQLCSFKVSAPYNHLFSVCAPPLSKLIDVFKYIVIV